MTPGDAASAPWEGATLSPAAYRWGLAGLVLLGALLRFAHLDRPFNGLGAWNEGHYAVTALNFDRYGLWSQRNDLGADPTFSPGVPWMIWAAFKMFGTTEWAARLPIALSGVAVILLVAGLARRLVKNEHVALIAASFAAVAPGFVYYSQNVQLDMPSLACGLAGALAMLRYVETRRRRYFVAAGVALMAAIWFKFSTALLYPAYLMLWWPVRPRRPVLAIGTAGAFVGLTALPSVAWIAVAWVSRGAQTHSDFYYRQWDVLGLSKALSEIPIEVATHLFAPIFIFLCVGLPLLIRWRSRFRLIWVWCAPWIVLYVLAPWSSLLSRYYDLPAAALLVVPAALGLWTLGARRAGGAAAARAVLVGIALALTVAYDLWDPGTDRIARATTPHAPAVDPAPFCSARVVATLPKAPTMMSAPQTMFYGGGDPAWISLGDGRLYIDQEKYDYIVLNDYYQGQEPYFAIDEALAERFARHHYARIAPLAWVHARTGQAILTAGLAAAARLGCPAGR